MNSDINTAALSPVSGFSYLESEAGLSCGLGAKEKATRGRLPGIVKGNLMPLWTFFLIGKINADSANN